MFRMGGVYAAPIKKLPNLPKLPKRDHGIFKVRVRLARELWAEPTTASGPLAPISKSGQALQVGEARGTRAATPNAGNDEALGHPHYAFLRNEPTVLEGNSLWKWQGGRWL